jgi:hypothetical protein
MSRITRERIEPGDAATSSDLNTRYSDYTQTDLNVDNATNPAFDEDQMPAQAVLINATQGEVGVPADIAHASPAQIAMTVGAGAATPVAVQRNVAVDPASGWTLASGTLLRVYFNLQCKSVIPVSPLPAPHDSTKMGAMAIGQFGSTAFHYVSIGAHCWLVQLQWNITSSALNAGDFVSVPGQGNFQSTWGITGKYGEPVSNLAGTAAIPMMWAGTIGWQDAQQSGPSTLEIQRNGWRNLSGSWAYSGSGQTVYGFRLVVHGVYHPYNNGADNGLVLEKAFAAGSNTFQYSLGNILAMHMRAD